MKLTLPEKCLLTAERNEAGEVQFTYAEKFNDPKIIKHTGKLAQDLIELSKLPVTVAWKDSWIFLRSNGFYFGRSL